MVCRSLDVWNECQPKNFSFLCNSGSRFLSITRTACLAGHRKVLSSCSLKHEMMISHQNKNHCTGRFTEVQIVCWNAMPARQFFLTTTLRARAPGVEISNQAKKRGWNFETARSFLFPMPLQYIETLHKTPEKANGLLFLWPSHQC